MRADSAGAKTWLLGALALWALCVWVLALFGLGGRVDRLAEDPSLLQPLPRAGKPPPARLGPLPRYAEIGQRPLFSPNRQPQPFFINPGGEEDDGKRDFDYVLTSVLIAPDFRMAILQPASGEGESVRLKPGEAPESAPGWTLASVDARSAVFNGPEGERELELRVFDGIGGQPPTPISTRRPDQPATRARPPSPEDMGLKPPQAGPGGRTANPEQSDADAAPPPTPPPGSDEASPRPSEEQIEAIRKRIEERRRKLREELQQQPPPDQTP